VNVIPTGLHNLQRRKQMFRPRGTGTKDPTHAKGSPEWLEFNKEKLVKTANTLTRLMGEAGLLPVAQKRLRKIFQHATNDDGMKYGVKVEKQLQAEETDKYHRDQHAAEYLAPVGVQIKDLKTECIQ
jgi:hypothetical protein